MIKSNLSPPPTFPATFWDLVPFLCAGGLALIFTALLVLLVDDDSSDSKLLGEQQQQSQLASYQRRAFGLSEKEREWSTRSHSSYYGYSPVQRNVTSSPAPATVTTQTTFPQRPVFPKRLFVLPPSPTTPTPTQASSTAPMLSMAKLIMHRHDQANRRARQARAQRQQLAAQQPSQSQSHPPARTPLRQ